MKKLILLFAFLATTAYSQTQQLYEMAFSNKENLKVLTAFNHTIPETFYIIDTTDTWTDTTFYLKDTNLNDPAVIKEIELDEHHPYHYNYIFSDKALDKLIDEKEKIRLSEVTTKKTAVKINITGSSFKTVKKFDKKEGFYFLLGDPIYSADKNYAFTKITVKSKETFLDDPTDEYFAIIYITFKKNGKGRWEQISRKDFAIL